MRLATIVDGTRLVAAVVDDGRFLPLAIPDGGLDSVRAVAASGRSGLRRVQEWVAAQPDAAYRSLDGVELGPAVPDPGAIYTVGDNYRRAGEPNGGPRPRPLIFAKAATSVAGHADVLSWDRALTANVDPECELGVVIGATGTRVAPSAAMAHVFGYTCINDVSSRDEWLDGDQWLLGKSMPGFCPVGPWVVTGDELDPADLGLGCTINGVAVQAGRTSDMRTSIADVVSYLSHHATLRPGDLIATGTPVRLAGPIGPDRHLQVGDVVTVWIEDIGELTTTIA